jgi:hypothetical protein
MTITVVQTAKIPDTWSGSFPGNVTAGNTLILVPTAYTNTGSAMSSSAPLYNGASVTGAAKLIDVNSGATNGVYTAIWMLPNVTGGHTSIGITMTGENSSPFAGSVGLTAYEVSGLGTSPALDKSHSSSATTGTAVTSGASGNITAVPEIVIGSIIIFGQAMNTVGSPWTESQYANKYSLLGYQVVTSGSSSYTYSQTGAASAAWCGAIATVKGTASPSGSGLLVAGVI